MSDPWSFPRRTGKVLTQATCENVKGAIIVYELDYGKLPQSLARVGGR